MNPVRNHSVIKLGITGRSGNSGRINLNLIFQYGN